MNRVIGAGLLLLLAACGGGEGKQQDSAALERESGIALGRYQTDSSTVLGHVVTLELGSRGRATLTRHFSGREAIETRGTFTAEGPNLQVTLPGQDSTGPATFRWRLVSNRLVPVDWDRTVYGPAGLTLHFR